jgi:hypothetical protein
MRDDLERPVHGELDPRELLMSYGRRWALLRHALPSTLMIWFNLSLISSGEEGAVDPYICAEQ